MNLSKLRLAALVAACLAAAAFAVRAVVDQSSGSGVRPPAASSPATALADGGAYKFRFLARQKSSRCDLQPSALGAMPDGMRLQGSCCSAMDLTAYRVQVRGLRAYRVAAEIPPDPYDIPVALAKRLVAYDRSIELTRAQAETYRQAMRASQLKGPCCCRCWRWDAFRGLSKVLIARRGWRSEAVANVVDLLDGCGGPHKS